MKNVIYQGIAAYADQFAVSKEGGLYFLSLYGNTQAVNGILAGIVQHSAIEVQLAGEPFQKLQPYARIDNSKNYIAARRNWAEDSKTHIKSVPLSWGRCHGVFWDDRCVLRQTKKDFVVIGADETDSRKRIFATLSARPIPLLESWQDVLFEILKEDGIITDLLSYGCCAYAFSYQEERILELIGDAIRSKSINI
ncbi:hypothetical protein L0156_20315 [bacterium]|nr:hypothetical protein [bacterium]